MTNAERVAAAVRNVRYCVDVEDGQPFVLRACGKHAGTAGDTASRLHDTGAAAPAVRAPPRPPPRRRTETVGADDLVLFMSLPGKQHEVAGPWPARPPSRSPRGDRRSQAVVAPCRVAYRP